MKTLASLSLFSLILITPLTAYADPKADIAAYEAAFDKGDEESAAKLLRAAFENAKTLPNSSAYIAKISYDNAVYFLLSRDFKFAFEAIQITKASFENNSALMKGADMKTFDLIYSYLKLKNENNKNQIAKDIFILNKASEALTETKRDDAILLFANLDLAYYYLNNNSWGSLEEITKRQIEVINNTSGLSTSEIKTFKMNNYVRSGQAKLLNAASKFATSPVGNRIGRTVGIDWQSAYSDILKAKIIYGAPKYMDDTTLAEIDVWLGIINAFAHSFSDDNKVKNAILEIEQREGYVWDKLKPLEQHDICINKFKFYKDINLYTEDPNFDTFGSTKIIYDINKENLSIENMRVVASYPSKEFGKAVVTKINGIKVQRLSETLPEYCYKNNELIYNFYIKFSN